MREPDVYETCRIVAVFVVVICITLILAYVIHPLIGYRPVEVKDYLEKTGYTNIEIGNYAVWACGSDTFNARFTALDPITHKQVEGAVCFNLADHKTIRLK